MTGAVVCAAPALDWGWQEKLVIRLRSIYIGHLSPGAHGTPQDEARLALDGGGPQPRGKVCMGEMFMWCEHTTQDF